MNPEESGGFLWIPLENGVNTRILVTQEFLQKIPVKAKKNRNSCDPLQNHIPVKKILQKTQEKRNPQESWREHILSKIFSENRNYQPRMLGL